MDGDEIPAIYADPPTLSHSEFRYWHLFGMVQRDRPPSFDGISFIPSAPIVTYLVNVARETDAREIDLAIRFVRAIDDEYVGLQRMQAEQNRKPEETPKS